MRKTLTDRGVAEARNKTGQGLRPARPRIDAGTTSGFSRPEPSRSRWRPATQAGKQKWATIGAADVLSIEEARKQARVAIARIRGGATGVRSPGRIVRSRGEALA